MSGVSGADSQVEAPAPQDPVSALLEVKMPGRGYSQAQVASALRLWEAAAIAMRPAVRKPSVWAAAVELSVLRLDAPDKARASEVAEAYGTGAAAASRRSGEMLRQLQVVADDPRFSERGQLLRHAPDRFASVEDRYVGRGQEPESGRDLEPVVLHCPHCRQDQTIAEPYRFVRRGRSGVAGRCPRCSRPLVRLFDDDQTTRDAEGSP